MAPPPGVSRGPLVLGVQFRTFRVPQRQGQRVFLRGCSGDVLPLEPGGPGLQTALEAHKPVGGLLSAAPPSAFVLLPKRLSGCR